MSSTRLSEVLTCWPPGPELLEKRQVKAAGGTSTRLFSSDNLHPHMLLIAKMLVHIKF